MLWFVNDEEAALSFFLCVMILPSSDDIYAIAEYLYISWPQSYAENLANFSSETFTSKTLVISDCLLSLFMSQNIVKIWQTTMYQ